MSMEHILHFKDSESAYEYACAYTPCECAIGENTLAMVVSCSRDKEQRKIISAKLADEARTIVSGIELDSSLGIEIGDLVVYRLGAIKPELPPPFDKIGVFGAKVASTWSEEAGWHLISFPSKHQERRPTPTVLERIVRYFRGW